MKTKIAVLSIIFALCTVVLASQRSLEELKAEAAKASPKDQPKLYVEIAELELKSVEALYNEGDAEKGQQAVEQLTADCEAAAKASKTTRKHMKHTEISLRKIGERLNDIQRSAAFDDRPPIKAALDRIEQARTMLLDAMFSK